MRDRVTFSLAAVMVVVGVVLIVETAIVGGALGFVLGALFVAAGSFRIKLLRGRPR